MEEVKGFDRRAHLINELLQGLELAKQLRNQLMNPASSCSSSSTSDDYNNQVALNNSLVEKMLSSFDKIITIVKLLRIQLPQDPSSINDTNHNYVPSSESPHSLTFSSPKSENSDPVSPPAKRRRPMMPKWTKNVQISNGGVNKGLEGALEDGFSWRKYGQKDILGAKFPRGYYRCTHRPTKGCAATKQVQRSDEDSSIYQIMYRGEHTCSQGNKMVQAQFNPIISAQMKSEPQPSLSPQQQEVHVGLGPESDLKVQPEQKPENHAQIFRSFSFTSTHLQPDLIENNTLSFCPPFGSPTTSESNYLPLSPCQATEAHTGLTILTSETDMNEAISGPNSVTNSPVKAVMEDFEFPIDELLDFGDDFSFEL